MSAADAFPGAWARVVVDNAAGPSFLFHVQATPQGGLYETHMSFEGRTFTLRGTVAAGEFERFMRGLEAYQGSPSLSPCDRSLLGPSARHAPHMTIYVMSEGGLRKACLDDAWSPQYQSTRRFLERTIVGRTQAALKRAAGFI